MSGAGATDQRLHRRLMPLDASIGQSQPADSDVTSMRTFHVIVERDAGSGLYVGSVPGWPGAHSQGATLEELERNLREVIGMLLEDGDPKLVSEFVGVRSIRVP